jgi:Bacterial protein of unknown function (Gcw_chp)
MNKLVMSAVAAAMMCSSGAIAADMPIKARPAPIAVASPWDVAFGGALMSDYNFRGISQSDRGPSVTAYIESRYKVNSNFMLYAGSQYWAIDLPTHGSCECDFFAGIRPTVGDFAFDFGYIYYWYPRERQVFLDAPFPAGQAVFIPTANVWTVKDTDYWEVYGKVAWDVVKERFALGANVYYSPDWLGSGAYGLYASGTAKVTFQSFTLPTIAGTKEIGWYISGEVGYYWLGTSDPILGSIQFPDYLTWNIGLAFTHKVFTLDLRYYDTDLTKEECFTLTGDLRGLAGGSNPIGQSKWCNPTFIVATKFDLTASDHLK